ncbi:hypothetical protein V6N11_070911 [Hibiscus sabdariffa]|uniref:Uncharacterized protein n=1 Tax=Hibiscus sabdariffa TaxID=183260 RepID=A0ABR2A467_9ROSI
MRPREAIHDSRVLESKNREMVVRDQTTQQSEKDLIGILQHCRESSTCFRHCFFLFTWSFCLCYTFCKLGASEDSFGAVHLRVSNGIPSPLVKVKTAGFDGELAVDRSVLDVLTTGSGYEIFLELDDLLSDFLGSWIPNIDFEEENLDGILNPESSLCNF